MKNSVDHKPKSKTPRVVTAFFGVFFIVVALMIVLSLDPSMLFGSVVAAFVIGWLGIDACVSAIRDKPSLLQRIGPLP